MSINDGGPAFPAPEASISHFGFPDAYTGMTMRDYFAAKVIGGLMLRNWSEFIGGEEELIAQWGKSAYMVADAMLKAREKHNAN